MIVGAGTVAAAPALVGTLLQVFTPSVSLLVLVAIMAFCVLIAARNRRHLHPTDQASAPDDNPPRNSGWRGRHLEATRQDDDVHLRKQR